MNNLDITQIMKDLESSQIERHIPAVEKAAEIVRNLKKQENTSKLVNQLVTKAIETFQNSSHPFLVSDRLSDLGESAIPHLENILMESNNSELNILAAVVLLNLGSKAGISILLDAVLYDESYHMWAAHCLTRHGIKEAIPLIINRLRKCEISKENDAIVSLLASLEESDGELPPDLHERFSVPDATTDLRFMLWKFRNKNKKFCDIDEFRGSFPQSLWERLEASSDIEEEDPLGDDGW
jgi:hypothetical protein